MNTRQQTDSFQEDSVSALVDGALQGDAFAEAVSRTVLEGEARSRWHAYHVVGDVLRSKDLSDCSGDLAFLRKLEARLALEPARTLAPAPEAAVPVLVKHRQAANHDVFRWKVAAGFASLAAVAAIGWQSMQWQSAPIGALLAQGQAPASDIQPVSLDPAAVPALAGGQGQPVMLRNAQLDELLAAHNRAVGGATLQSESRLVRNVSITEERGR